MRSAQRKEIFTTGDVSRICHVAPRTVSKWFDTGKLNGYRIPGSRDRRIPRNQLLSFMRAHGLPMDGLDLGICRILMVDPEPPVEIAEALNASDRYELRTAENEFEAGVVAQQFRPHVIVLHVTPGDHQATTMCRNIKATATLQSAKVIATISGCPGHSGASPAAQDFDEVLQKPYSLGALVQVVENATNLIT